MIKRIILHSLILIVAAVFVLIPTRAESASGDTFSITVTVPTEITSVITTPGTGQTCSQTPTITGTTTLPNETVEIRGTSAGSETSVATTTSDSAGNFVVEVNPATPLSLGNNTLTPYVNGSPGTGKTPIVSASPTPSQEPTITSPAEGEKIKGRRPTISGLGKAGETVTLYTKDPNGTVVQMGQGTVNADGTFSITPSSDFALGVYQIYLVVGESCSQMLSITFVDPYGIVYDSQTNQPIEGAQVKIQRSTDGGITWFDAVPGVDIAATDQNPQTTGSDGAYSYLTVNGAFRFVVSKNGYTFPSTIITMGSPQAGSHGELFTVAGAVLNIDIPMDFSGSSLLKIEKAVNKKEVAIGDILTYAVTIKNEGATNVTGIYLKDKLPAGFKYLSGKTILDGNKIDDPTGERTKTFNIGTVSAGETRILKYQLIVGSGVSFGKYENSAVCQFSNGRSISNTASETVRIIPDPLFDLGTVIGKVFHDRNGNGIQDPPYLLDGRTVTEEPIPNVQIVTEEGAVITTDKDGKFHLQSLTPGRHLFKIDKRALPEGAELTTQEVVVVDITSGLLAKVNFGVKIPDGSAASSQVLPIIQEQGSPQPRLNVSLINDGLIIQNEGLKEKAEFRIFTNYQLFIQKWELEILDKETKRLIQVFRGKRDNIFESIYWDGKDKAGKLISPDRHYVYRLKVVGAGGKEDITKERDIVILKELPNQEDKSQSRLKKERVSRIKEENTLNNLEKQTIVITGQTIRFPEANLKGVRILKGNEAISQVEAEENSGLTAAGLLASQKQNKPEILGNTEIILPPGEYDIEAIPQEGKSKVSQEEIGSITKPSSQYASRHIKVGDDYLTFVALGDGKIGYTFERGNIEPAGSDDKFKEGFWSEGKLAYYLKGKIKGKYLITSSFDSERSQKELFKNLDPNKYYPIYGDASSVNYSATDTQGMLYLLVEWDKSSLMWGNYNTALTDTEFAQFSRSLYGGKVYLQSISTTKFGEPNTKIIVFNATAKQKAAHNEFVGTGGSLFYLKHKDITEGSDNVKIEVRDKITGLVLATENMKEGVDYDIDYTQGRIIFWRPVSSIAESNSIISSKLLDGNPVYVVVDYEYEVEDKYDEGTMGGRIQQSLGDYISIGGTYVKEGQLNKNYQLQGTDATVHLGKNITVVGEYAQSESEQLGSFISTDGGLSFTELATGNADKGKAYGLKAEAYLLDKKLGLSSYYKRIDNNFSSSSTVSQQGKELTGFGATYDLSSKTRLSLSHDVQKLIDGGNLQTQLQVGAQKIETSLAQVTHEMDKLKLTGEYRHQEVKEKKEQFASETNTEEDTLAARADYQLTQKVDVSLEQQVTLKGSPQHKTTAGIIARIFKWLTLRVKQAVGTRGSATTVGVTTQVKDKLELSGDYTKANAAKAEGVSASADDFQNMASLSATAKVDDKTKLYTTYALTDSIDSGKTSSLTFGSKRKINDEIELSAERTFASSKDKKTSSQGFGLLREKNERKLEAKFSRQHSEAADEISDSNIFGLSGDINDKWAAEGSFERGLVQNLNATETVRNACSFGVSFVNKDKETQEVKLRASSKLELRFDNGQEDKRQYLLYNALEGKLTPDITLFTKINLSQTENTSTNSTEARV